MTRPDYDRVGSVIAQVLARMVLTQPDADEEGTDADDLVRESVD